MAKGKPVAGLDTRIAAARRFADVLGGAAFSPLHAGDLADQRDRALANRLITTALRHHGPLSAALKALLEKGLPSRSGLFEAHLRLALAQLLYLPELGDHSAIFLAVEGIRRDRRASRYDKLANGVLRRAQREAEALRGDSSPQNLFPDWLTARWNAAYGEAALTQFAAALLEGAPLDLTLKASDPTLVDELGATPVIGDTVRLAHRDAPVPSLFGYEQGAWWVQDAAAAIPATLFTLPPASKVLDLCAAPGGKTLQLVKAGYEVIALDNDAARLKRVEENLARLNYSAELVDADATNYASDDLFDGILVDAPCSATGTFRRHPEVVWLRTEKDLKSRIKLQRQIVANAAKLLKPGGELIFCTCSLESEEGEQQADWIANELNELELLPLSEADLPDLVLAITDNGCLRTHPGMTVPGVLGGAMDGFFAARFRRN